MLRAVFSQLKTKKICKKSIYSGDTIHTLRLAGKDDDFFSKGWSWYECKNFIDHKMHRSTFNSAVGHTLCEAILRVRGRG